MMHVTVRKLFNGRVDIRSTTILKAQMNDEDICVHFNGQTMTIAREELARRVVDVSENFQSKFGNNIYRLFSYKWVADTDKRQLKLVL